MSNQPFKGPFPDSLEEYVGQEQAIHQITTAIDSAKRRGAVLDHILLESSIPGLGKTALAQLIIRLMDRPVCMLGGTPTLDEVYMKLVEAELVEGCFVFFDEVHQAAKGGSKKAEWLLHLLTSGVLIGSWGVEEFPPFTFIATTTDAGLLPPAVLDRFKLRPTLVPYTAAEGAQIATVLGSKLLSVDGLPNVDELTAAAITQAANNRPRAMERMLIAARDLAITDQIAHTNGRYELDAVFDFCGVTDDGLSAKARKYMTILRNANGQPVGAQVLANRVGAVGSDFREIESVLIDDKEFVTGTTRGRRLTKNGIRRAKKLVAA